MLFNATCTEVCCRKYFGWAPFAFLHACVYESLLTAPEMHLLVWTLLSLQIHLHTCSFAQLQPSQGTPTCINADASLRSWGRLFSSCRMCVKRLESINRIVFRRNLDSDCKIREAESPRISCVSAPQPQNHSTSNNQKTQHNCWIFVWIGHVLKLWGSLFS